MESSPRSISEIAYEYGYKDIYFFSRQFKQVMGLSPVNGGLCSDMTYSSTAADIIAIKFSYGTYSGILFPEPRAYPPFSSVNSRIAFDLL